MTKETRKTELQDSIRKVLKKLLGSSQNGIIIKYLMQLKFITTGLEVKTFARVYVNLKLSVNKKCVAYGTMVMILATLTSSCAKACYLI